MLKNDINIFLVIKNRIYTLIDIVTILLSLGYDSARSNLW